MGLLALCVIGVFVLLTLGAVFNGLFGRKSEGMSITRFFFTGIAVLAVLVIGLLVPMFFIAGPAWHVHEVRTYHGVAPRETLIIDGMPVVVSDSSEASDAVFRTFNANNTPDVVVVRARPRIRGMRIDGMPNGREIAEEVKKEVQQALADAHHDVASELNDAHAAASDAIERAHKGTSRIDWNLGDDFIRFREVPNGHELKWGKWKWFLRDRKLSYADQVASVEETESKSKEAAVEAPKPAAASAAPANENVNGTVKSDTESAKVGGSEASPPDWVLTAPEAREDMTFAVVHGTPMPDEHESVDAALVKAAKFVQEFYEKEFGSSNGRWRVTPDYVKNRLVREAYTGPTNFRPIMIETDKEKYSDLDSFEQTHLLLQLDEQSRRDSFASWRNAVSQQRLLGLGGLFALATLITGASATYFRVDEKTKGAYRGRLRFAAFAVIAAAICVGVSVFRMGM